ncbi:MAG: hypothetical protein HYY76_04360 [Acidobacteria bacterium]|nr:hypothetical protein [Acidobacteriota bacterium]
MASFSVPWWISAVWGSLTLLTFLALDASSLRSWVLATTIGIVPPVVLLRLWSSGPPPTVAEVLHTTEVGR